MGRAMTSAPAESPEREESVEAEANIECYIGSEAGFWTECAAWVDSRLMRSTPSAPVPRAPRLQEHGGVRALPAREERISNLHTNLATLAARGVEQGLDIASWERASGVIGESQGVSGGRSGADRVALPFVNAQGEMDPAKPVKGIVLEGFDSPWMLLRVHRSTQALADGYAPPIFVVERDAVAAMDALSELDLCGVLADPRVTLFVGESAASDLAAHLASRLDYAMPDYLVPTPGGSARPVTGAAEAVQRAHAMQQAGHAELEAKARGVYDVRDAQWWKERFREGLAAGKGGAGRPLRVLIPVSRYSTFVRHSAADLAEALRLAGHEAEVLTEPDDHSRLVTLAYLRKFAEWQPDMVVLINYTRRHMGQAVPRGVPFVCWVQDRMPQLFDEAVGRSQGAMDFLMGHLHIEMFWQFGYPKDAARARFRFVPASARTFHDGAVEASLVDRSTCDIAYISHQSETAEAARARLMPAFTGNPAIGRAVERVYRRLEALMECPESFDPIAHLRAPLVSDALASEGVVNPDPRLTGAILSNFAVPIAERMWRHATLAWSARIAEKRGWNLAIFGNGWDQHPTMARYARGGLSHDEALRAVYRSARVCLHASLTTNAHQRVFECALSGGVMLRRGPSPDREVGAHALRHWLLRRFQPVEKSADGVWTYEIAPGDPVDPRAMHAVAGRDPNAARTWVKLIGEEGRRQIEQVWPEVDLLQLPDYAFPLAWETMFTSETELEAMVERAIGDDAWRAETARLHRQAALERHTYDRLAQDLLEMTGGAIVGVREADAA